MTKARDLSKLLSTANGKIAGANLDVSFENISDTGTQGTKVASGTTAQRGSTAGQIRFNTTTGLAEYYTGSEFKIIDTPPTITAISPLDVDSTVGGNITFTITGSNFGSGAVTKFIGSDATEITASTTTVNSGSSISAIIARSSFVNAKEPYDVRVINISTLSATLDNQINVDTSPTWSTASGTLATILDTATGTHATVSATDVDGDTVSYSETGGTVLTTAGLSLNSSTGAISGDPTDVASSTTYSFNLRATANSKTVDRAFNIIVNRELNGLTSDRAFTSLSGASSLVPNSGNIAVRYFRNSANSASYLLGVKNVSGTLNWLMPIGSTSYTESTRTVQGSDYWFNASIYTNQSFGSGAMLFANPSGTILRSNGGSGSGTPNTQQTIRKINLGINFRYFSVENFNCTGYGANDCDWDNYQDPTGATMDMTVYSDSVGIIVGKSGNYKNGNPFSAGGGNITRTASIAEEDLGYSDGTELALYATGDTSTEYYDINSGTILFRP